MGNKFLAPRKSEVARVAPDRAALMGKVDMKEIREANERWLCLLFGKSYEAEFQSKGMGSAIHSLFTVSPVLSWHESVPLQCLSADIWVIRSVVQSSEREVTGSLFSQLRYCK